MAQQNSKPMAQWQAESSRKIVKHIIAEGTLILQTPAHFGTGQQTGTELIILEDALENKPLLPGASIAGALRHYLWEREKGYRNHTEISEKSCAGKLFGTALEEERKRGQQSRVLIDDALGEGKLVIRDGVMIEGDTRTAKDKALFSTQVWERGTSFKLYFELCIYESDKNPQELEQAFATALTALGKGEIPLGARKHRGYGRATVNDWLVHEYNMGKPDDLILWLRNQAKEKDAKTFLEQAKDFVDKRQYIRIKATMNLCDSLLIRAGSDLADSAHLTSDGQPVLSGTSLAGSLRGRALRIANSIPNLQGTKLVDDMFGLHGDTENKDNLTASRVIVEEHLIENAHFDYIQSRVKIDRFTGGAFDTALFEEQPVFAKDDTRVPIVLEIRFPVDLSDEVAKEKDSKKRDKKLAQISDEQALVKQEAGLLLLLLKDLWTEDLALGGESNIGRGRLRGKEATIYIKTNEDKDADEVTLNEKGLVSPPNTAGILHPFVDALWSEEG
jgi:CRISPR/Cas system CSM-associated protein Csm3 (group 7 of RAMP superfamily)